MGKSEKCRINLVFTIYSSGYIKFRVCKITEWVY
nr:MAG TPA: hypothetical protein [Caudoviricetes sp.]